MEAVVRTSVALPVKERIAEGLSRAGTSNSLKVLTYNIILGVIAFFSHGAIRQFCAFAIVVLVAHWFLVHTFFVAVLSIDLQRLELEELLQQDASLAPAVPVSDTRPPKSRPSSAWMNVMASVRGMLQGRAAKNVSLVVVSPLHTRLQHHLISSATSYSRRRRLYILRPTLPCGRRKIHGFPSAAAVRSHGIITRFRMRRRQIILHGVHGACSVQLKIRSFISASNHLPFLCFTRPTRVKHLPSSCVLHSLTDID